MTIEVKGIKLEELDQHFKNKNENKSRFEYQDKSLMAKMGFLDNQLKTPEHDKMIDMLMDDAVLSKIATIAFNDKEKYGSMFTWFKKEEFIVKGNNDYIIGYVDVAAFSEGMLEKQIVNKYGKEEYISYYGNNCDGLFIEAKSIIDSIGEVIRQINTYREFLCENQSTAIINKWMCKFVIITPNTDDRQRKRFEAANIVLIDIKELI